MSQHSEDIPIIITIFIMNLIGAIRKIPQLIVVCINMKFINVSTRRINILAHTGNLFEKVNLKSRIAKSSTAPHMQAAK